LLRNCCWRFAAEISPGGRVFLGYVGCSYDSPDFQQPASSNFRLCIPGIVQRRSRWRLRFRLWRRQRHHFPSTDRNSAQSHRPTFDSNAYCNHRGDHFDSRYRRGRQRLPQFQRVQSPTSTGSPVISTLLARQVSVPAGNYTQMAITFSRAARHLLHSGNPPASPAALPAPCSRSPGAAGTATISTSFSIAANQQSGIAPERKYRKRAHAERPKPSPPSISAPRTSSAQPPCRHLQQQPILLPVNFPTWTM